jgi:hypothetical protein
VLFETNRLLAMELLKIASFRVVLEAGNGGRSGVC